MHYIPLIFCLLPGKNQTVYTTILNLLTDKCNENNLTFLPKNVVIDFELGIHNAVNQIWKDVNIIGCRFHLSQAWYRKILSLGLSDDYKNNTDVGKTLKYFFGLQFLNPIEVGDCFTFDLISDIPKNNKLEKFCDYLTDNYITEDSLFPPHIWASSSASTSRTTNACESFHSRFNKSFYATHPNIFQFLDQLLSFQSEVYVKIKSCNRYIHPVRPTIRIKQKYIQSKIEEFMLKTISRLDFVKTISYKYAPIM